MSEDKDFQQQFRAYLETVPAEVLGPIILNHGDIGWRVEMIKRSGLMIPQELRLAMEEYEKEEKDHKEELERMREIAKIMEKDGYSGVKLWWKANITGKGVPSKTTINKAIIKLKDHDKEKTADLTTYQLMKAAAIAE
jgi:hypothetical protein